MLLWIILQETPKYDLAKIHFGKIFRRRKLDQSLFGLNPKFE